MNTTQDAPNPQLIALSTLLQLEKEARLADSHTTLGFIAVNETHRLFPYAQAVLCTITPSGRIKIISVSGVATVDAHAPFIRWLRQLIQHHIKEIEIAQQIHPLQPEKLPSSVQSGWQTWSSEQVLWCPFIHAPSGYIEAGLLLFRKNHWREAEITLLGYLTDAYAHAWSALRGGHIHKPVKPLRRWFFRILVLVGLAASTLLSIHESVLAPAEIVAQSPLIVTAPMEGTIKQFYVQPNQNVEVGQKLFTLDDTVQKNRYTIAQKTLAVARADLLRAEQKAFLDPSSRGEVALLRAKVEEREAELEYVAEILKRLSVRAEQSGITVFTDVNDWLGKPVNVGEKVMFLANPKLTEIQLWVPVTDAINLAQNAPVQLFLNTDPTSPLSAHLYQASYEAELTPDNWLAFRAKAQFTSQDSLPRIGLKGTSKIYGQKVNLYYYLLRRPWAVLRQSLGL
ncbi:MAG: hypothetical protein DRQ49_10595 [Gammaproteobacteria bacterium]|nr:MAG: hypothetical protein DRQ49_10595 [Gammaproteobacteria bacterium]RKZ73821.1 MAG: hypothetical protein DRQ57_13115 [Gammaproteobacteria bacterium]